jgi:hypothetical protein
MKRRLGNSLFWLITIGCALATCALVIPRHVNAAASYVASSCESAWGPHLGTCRCDCRANWSNTSGGFNSSGTVTFRGSARARELFSGSSTGYTDTNAVAVTNPNNQGTYNGTQARTRINCTDTDVNFAQINSAWSPKYTGAFHQSSFAQCPGAAPIAYESFCKVKVHCTATLLR